ncbi:hypothetical protein Dimus_022259, partial [Dionaea muscipula]
MMLLLAIDRPLPFLKRARSKVMNLGHADDSIEKSRRRDSIAIINSFREFYLYQK